MPFIITIFLVTILMPATVCADKIVLKNGKIIKSEWVKRQGSSVRYEYSGGEVSIPLKKIKKIIYEEAAPKTITTTPENSTPTQASNENDLNQILSSKRPSRTPIEKATLATVSIDAGPSFGSGFFISEDGYIITNKHVIRGSVKQDKSIGKHFNKADRNLDKFKQYLDRQYADYNRSMKNFKRDWSLYLEMKQKARTDIDKKYMANKREHLLQNKDQLKDWKRQLDEEKREYKKQRGEYKKSLKKFNSSKKELSKKNTFKVILVDDTKLYATLYKISSKHDLALLKVNGYKTPKLQSKNSRYISQGDELFAIGSPIRMKNSVTDGVFSGYEGSYIQTNAQIYPGNSGGPLVNKDGDVIGINTMKLITHGYEGIGFAIPIETALAEFKDYL